MKHFRPQIPAVFFVLLTFSCSPQPEKRNPVTVAQAQFESVALHWVAEDQKFFDDVGLDVTTRQYASGVGALEALVKGEAVIAVGTSEFPVVDRAFKKEKIRIVGNIAKSDIIYIVGRKDHGVEKITDLKGKRIGTTTTTIAHFFLGRFLELHGMTMQDIILVDLKTPGEWVDALVTGQIDAVATAQPYAHAVKGHLGENASVWSAQSSQSLYALAISTEEWIKSHPELVTRYLQSLSRAEEFMLRYPTESKAIIQRHLNSNAAYAETVWGQNRFVLSLDQAFIIAMEDEARWMISNRLTTEKDVPDFLNVIYEEGLKSIKPDKVTIVR
jgi:NitT/TauT family transport system substrate-binding protein